MIESLSMVTRMVADQSVAKRFYTETLGFEVRRDHDGPHGRFLTVAASERDPVELILMTPEGFEEPDAGRLSKLIGNDAGLIYTVDDCEATYRTLRERDVEGRSPPKEMPWGVQAVIADPDGNEIVLQERPLNPDAP